MTKFGTYGEPRETRVVVENSPEGPVLKYMSKKVGWVGCPCVRSCLLCLLWAARLPGGYRPAAGCSIAANWLLVGLCFVGSVLLLG